MSYRILVLSIVVLSFFAGCSKEKITDPTPIVPLSCDSVRIGSQVWM